MASVERLVLDGQLSLIIRLVVVVVVLPIAFVEYGRVVGSREGHLVTLFAPIQLLYPVVEKEARHFLVALLLEAERDRHLAFLSRRLVFGQDDFQTDGRTVASLDGLVAQHLHHIVFAQLTQGLGADPLLDFPLLDQSPEKKESELSEITRERLLSMQRGNSKSYLSLAAASCRLVAVEVFLLPIVGSVDGQATP